jgi:hypothetical protein
MSGHLKKKNILLPDFIRDEAGKRVQKRSLSCFSGKNDAGDMRAKHSFVESH